MFDVLWQSPWVLYSSCVSNHKIQALRWRTHSRSYQTIFTEHDIMKWQLKPIPYTLCATSLRSCFSGLLHYLALMSNIPAIQYTNSQGSWPFYYQAVFLFFFYVAHKKDQLCFFFHVAHKSVDTSEVWIPICNEYQFQRYILITLKCSGEVHRVQSVFLKSSFRLWIICGTLKTTSY